MLAAHTTPDPRDLYTISAGGFSATADAFARDPDTEGLWFLSMVGPQTALKAIWAALLKQPADAAHGVRLDGRRDPLGRLSPLFDSPGDRGHLGNQDHLPARFGRLARVGLHADGRARLRAGLVPAAGSLREGGARHPPAFLDRRSPLPLHRSWADWLWWRGLGAGEIAPLQSAGVAAYLCKPDAGALREDLARAVASGLLTLPREDTARLSTTTATEGETR